MLEMRENFPKSIFTVVAELYHLKKKKVIKFLNKGKYNFTFKI